uniref:Pre-rRNA-processing protein Ipi1 N-terminal domain-containing protein n=1 Tax=Anopheles culicifacies TaxID=139723 RepID=A0A182MC05_9DIPT
MGGNSRKFKKAEKSKIKLKGAKLPKGTNVTKTNFKVRKIVVPDQLKQRNLTDAAVLSSRNLSLKDCLAKLKLNNVSSKIEGLRGVREIITKMPSELQRMLSAVVKDVASLSIDIEHDVRKDTYKTLGCILVACGPSVMVPFYEVLLSFLRCSMTHIQSRIQEDSLLLLDVLLQHLPELIVANRDKILPQFLDMISKLRTESKPGRTLTINLDKQSTSTRWRVKVLSRLTEILKILIDSKAIKKETMDTHDEISHPTVDADNPFASKVSDYQPNKPVPINYDFDGTAPMFLPLHKRHLYTICPMDVLFRKSSGTDKDQSLGDRIDDGRKLKMYVEMLMPVLLESWLEVRPVGTGSDAVQEHALTQEAAATLELLMAIFIQLWELIVQYSKETNNDDMKQWFREEYSTKFSTHILGGFPYYQSGTEAKSQGKRSKTTAPIIPEKTVDDHCYRHNFNICFFYCCLHEQFRGGKKKSQAYTKIVEYVKRCVLNWKFRGAEATNLLLQVLRYMLLDTDCMSVNQETRALLQTLLEVYITAKLPQDIRNRILLLFCDIIVLNDSLWRRYGQELFTLWLKMLPNLLCKPTIDLVVLKALLCLGQRGNVPFLEVLETNAKQIVANLGTIRVTNELNPGEGFILICNLLFYIRKRELIKELLACDAQGLKEVSQRERLCKSFGQNYPEEFDGSLDCISLAVTCAFNKYGTLLAVGCNDGRVVIWDFLTRGIAKIISAHVHPVCSLCWSRNGHKLLSASTDNNVCIWDVLSGDCEQKYRFPSPILKVQFHPRNDNKFLVCPMRYAAILVDVGGKHECLPLDNDGDLNIVAAFDRRGDHIYTGNAKGKILVLNADTLEIVASFKIVLGSSSVTAVKSIEFARRGEAFLVNTSDRVIRVYDSMEVVTCGKDGEPEPIQKLQDLVNKTTWKKCCFSGDGEYICAGSARQHALYVWEKSIGNLVKILHGTKGELLLDVVWHPVRPIIASISSGLVSIWAQNQVENWSAFAPDFKELDENVEYEERESEFDITDEDKSVDLAAESKQDEEVEVDVVSAEPIAAFCSSDEEYEDENALQFLPMAPEVEDPEDGWGSQDNDTLGGGGGFGASVGGLGGGGADSMKENEPSMKKRKTSQFEITLDNAPIDDVHPLLQNKTNKDKQSTTSKKAAGRPRK